MPPYEVPVDAPLVKSYLDAPQVLPRRLEYSTVHRSPVRNELLSIPYWDAYVHLDGGVAVRVRVGVSVRVRGSVTGRVRVRLSLERGAKGGEMTDGMGWDGMGWGGVGWDGVGGEGIG